MDSLAGVHKHQGHQPAGLPCNNGGGAQCYATGRPQKAMEPFDLPSVRFPVSVKYQVNYTPIRVLRGMELPLEPITPIVVGCGRGGTTMIAGIIHLIGIPMAEPDPQTNKLPINFERPELIKLHDTLGGDHKRLTSDISQWIGNRNRFYGSSSWGWKHPASETYLEGILAECRNPCVLFVIRSLFDVCVGDEAANNAAKRPFGAVEFMGSFTHNARRLNQLHEIISRIETPVAYVGFEKAQRFPVDLVNGLSNYLGIQPTEEQVTRSLAFIGGGRGYKQV